MIVEYFGIPGGGKTYHANLYKKQMEEAGRPFFDISRHKGTPLWLKLLYKLADCAIYILPKYKKQIDLYNDICKNCEKDISRLKSRIHNIVFFSLVYDVVSKIKRTIINDEGQIHWILSLYANNKCPLEEVLKVYSQNKHNVILRCVKTTTDVAFKNIRKRNRQVCYVDKLNDSALRNYLSSFEDSCDILIKHLKTEIIYNQK